jgi:hypothetical protein
MKLRVYETILEHKFVLSDVLFTTRIVMPLYVKVLPQNGIAVLLDHFCTQKVTWLPDQSRKNLNRGKDIITIYIYIGRFLDSM